jgi:hypothetical protein
MAAATLLTIQPIRAKLKAQTKTAALRPGGT